LVEGLAAETLFETFAELLKILWGLALKYKNSRLMGDTVTFCDKRHVLSKYDCISRHFMVIIFI